ncbi:MAG: GtrA family protein [Leptospiraceae bacterium]|nr:GtrA family protein [Leptospiraceae bacterium]
MLIFGRYVISGTAIFGINLLIAYLIFSVPLATQPNLSKNIANIIATELAYLAAFSVHYLWTWRHIRDRFWLRLIKFHVVSLLGFCLRALIFGVLIYFDISWELATLISIASVLIFNFLGYFSVVFNPPAPEPESIRDAYAESGAGLIALETIEEAQNYNQYIAAKILPYCGNLNLEIGAGTGTITATIANSARVIACEHSDEARKILVERFRGNSQVQIGPGDYFRYNDVESLDCIYSSNVLEHIEDDLSVIEHAGRILKTGGYFVAFVPAGMWLYSKFDLLIGHYRMYGLFDRR